MYIETSSAAYIAVLKIAAPTPGQNEALEISKAN